MCQHLFLHQILQLDKINNHTLVVGSALYLYHQLIGMTVQMLALAVIRRQIMRSVKIKFLNNYHLYSPP